MTDGGRRWKHYTDFGYEDNEDLTRGILEHTIIPDIKEAEEAGTGPPLSSFTPEQLQEKLSEAEIILNRDHIEILKEQGKYKEAAELMSEIQQVERERRFLK
jgi:hypothetical protein